MEPGTAVSQGGEVAGAPRPTRVDRRRQATRAAILAAARELAQQGGLAELSLRDLAAEVGMKAPSLYSYFGSKAAIHDALFAEGYRELELQLDALDWDRPVPEVLRAAARTFLGFCVADLPRYQLMFTRVLPGWEPSPEAYLASQASYERMVERLAHLGITEQASIDLWTALTAGLAAQQIANDPDGDRWLRLVDEVVDLFLAHLGGDGR
jgi:AcrR family transcriptional regulator